ncbi:hypothetical protein [Clostridium paridis]|uniref:Uncharacterized protein n=1 Tax=Clostridium paridis TaxID=2803863 RepID=A0A937FI81_9CLOT|nr:hypothetical protein [Clostridium paridis]MBL4932568.1 hypothetical protein [Clostridium paridis]
MPEEFFQYLILLFIIIFLLRILIKVRTSCPRKLKVYMLISCIFALLSFISQFYIALGNNQQFIIYFKPLIYLDNLATILFSILILYVLLRKEKLEFNFAYVLLFLFTISYIVYMYLAKAYVKVDNDYGFMVVLTTDFIYRITYMLIILILSSSIIIFLDYKYAVRVPLILLLSVTIGVILENILYLSNIRFFAYPIFSELLVILLLNYSLSLFKGQVKATSTLLRKNL